MTVADFQGRSPLTSVLDAISHTVVPSVLWHCRLGGRKGIWPVKNGGWWRWALISPDGVAPSWTVCLPLLIFPCTLKSRGSLLAPAHPGGPGKRAVKRLCVYVCVLIQLCSVWALPPTYNLLLSFLSFYCLFWSLSFYYFWSLASITVRRYATALLFLLLQLQIVCWRVRCIW